MQTYNQIPPALALLTLCVAAARYSPSVLPQLITPPIPAYTLNPALLLPEKPGCSPNPEILRRT